MQIYEELKTDEKCLKCALILRPGWLKIGKISKKNAKTAQNSQKCKKEFNFFEKKFFGKN